MNDYGFDYLNYVTNVPSNYNFNNQNQNMKMNKTGINNSYLSVMDGMKQIPGDVTKGFLRGNLFESLYNPYDNYKPMELNPKNEREALLYQLLQYKFALTDLDLYLDTHPNDSSVVELYQKYLKIAKQICDKYESKYGPLTLDSSAIGKNNFLWKNSPWPWEVM